MRQAFGVVVWMTVVLGLVRGEYPKAWIDLFEPPYATLPAFSMAIGCVANDTCYIPAISQNKGSQVLKFDGRMGGSLIPLQNEGSEFDFEMQLAVGGTREKPLGAVGGVDWWYGLKYFASPTQLLPAKTTPFTETSDIRTDRSGQQVLTMNGFDYHGWGGMFSNDGGVTYRDFLVIQGDVPNPSCRIPSFVSIAANDTWYVVASSVPGTNQTASSSSASSSLGTPVHHKNDKNLRYFKPHVATLRKGADLGAVLEAGFKPNPRLPTVVHRSLLKQHREWVDRGRPLQVGDTPCGYGTSILKTTDGGATWTQFNFNSTEWSLNDIDCLNATHCVAVGYGPSFGSVVATTVDGNTWSIVLTIPGNYEGFTSLNAVRYNPVDPTELWAGGGYETPHHTHAVFYVSRDSGATWSSQGTVDFIQEVLEITFAPDGTGFAIAVTEFSVMTILRYTYYGVPATPEPTWSGSFSQVQCTDNNCSVNCQVYSFEQNVCLNVSTGVVATARCYPGENTLVENIFPLEAACDGPWTPVAEPLNQCLENQGGGSFYTVCGPVPTPPPGTRLARGKRPLMRARKTGK